MNNDQPFEQMMPDERRTWLTNLQDALQRKMQRERAYLDRRARRGIRTPTDEVYEQDQLLENDLLKLIEYCLTQLAVKGTQE